MANIVDGQKSFQLTDWLTYLKFRLMSNQTLMFYSSLLGPIRLIVTLAVFSVIVDCDSF